MASGAKVLGHPIHTVLIVYPLGLLSTAVLFDIIRMITGDSSWSIASYYMIGVGVISGLLAAIFGFVDWKAITNGTRAKSVGRVHGLGNVVVVVLFAASWWLRTSAPESPSGLALTCSFLGVLLAFVTGWLGGELVFRHGVGVEIPASGG